MLQCAMRSSWRAGEEMKSAAKGLRREATKAERALWEVLRTFRAEGFPFRRQVPTGPFVLDFYCPAVRLAIEAYGGIHDLDSVARRDTEREEILLETYAIKVLCIANNQILEDPQGVRELIANALEAAVTFQSQEAERTGTGPSPAKRERGAEGGLRVSSCPPL